ncbi:MAG: hypothetical protein ACMUIE_02135 [Thermoplasmatota archaeon]
MKNKSLAVSLAALMLCSLIVLNNDEGSAMRYMDMDLSDSHASFWGESASDMSGISTDSAGDVNGDGYDDIIIGAAQNSETGSYAGQTYIIFGKPSGWSPDADLSDSDASFRGEYSNDEAGYSVAGVGDVNGDGFDDIAIGAFGWDDGFSSSVGKTYIIFGKEDGWKMDTSLSTADASFKGESSSDDSGFSVAGAGDVNGDGYDDFLIGAYGNDEGGGNAGQAYLVLGKRTGWSSNTALSNVDASFIGEDAGDYAGYSIAGAGDLNGDGYDDIVVASPYDDDGGTSAGQVYIILGKPSGWTMNTDLSNADASFWGEDGGDVAGWSVSGAGDVNGDGFDDVLISALGDDDGGSNAGQTYLILGRPSGWKTDRDLSNSDASFWGEDANDSSGVSVSGTGDVNGDGYDDFLIGAYYDDDGGSDAGQVYLITGKSTGWSMDTDLSNATSSFWGEDAGDHAGKHVSGAGDVNGDGYDDLLISSPDDEEGASYAGQTYLWFYMSGPPSPKFIDVSYDPDKREVGLSWKNPRYWKPLSGYTVYRSMDGRDYEEVSATGLFFREYIDREVELHKTYYYSIRTIDGSGIESGHSHPVSIYCDHDDDRDGIGDSFDPDLDNDNILNEMDLNPEHPDPVRWGKIDVDLTGNYSGYIGEDGSDFAGYCVSGAGDVNGDGYDDILIGAYQDDDGGSNSGQTYLIFGNGTGMDTNFDLSNADASFLGEDADDNSGRAVSGAGDVNGDGYDDFLIGAIGDDDGGTTAGQTYLILGKPAGWSRDTDLSEADASFIGEDSGDYSGYAVSGAGDVNADGYDDFLINALLDEDGGSNSGQTYLILGKPTGWKMDADLSDADASFIGEDADDRSGQSISGAGDVNGDGFDDILIGAVQDDDGGANAGQVYLVYGKRSGWSIDTDLSKADASFWGEDAGDLAGQSVSGAGDVNGDGYDDILIGANSDDDGGTDAGQTYLILGRSSGLKIDTDLSEADGSFWGESASDRSGVSVSGAGDVNGDGFDDILIGAYANDEGATDAGQSYIFYGKPAGWRRDVDLSEADASFYGEKTSDYSGWSVSGAGDVDRDGLDDILIGAYGNDKGGTGAGKVYLIDHIGPVTIRNLSATALQSSMNLTWDDVGNSTYIYGIYRGTDPHALYRLNSTTDNDYKDIDIQWNLTYYYGVVTVEPLGGESTIVITDAVKIDKSPSSSGSGSVDLSALEAAIDALAMDIDYINSTVLKTWNIADYMNRTQHTQLSALLALATSINDTIGTDNSAIKQLLYNILGNLTYMNSTVLPSLSNIYSMVGDSNNILKYMNISFSTDLDNILSYVIGSNNYLKGMNASVHSELSDILTFLIENNNHLKHMNASIDSDLADLLTFIVENNNRLKYLNSSLGSDITDILDYLIAHNAHLEFMNDTIWSDLTELRTFIVENNNHLKYMNASIDSDLTELLDFVVENNNHLKFMNTSIRSELTELRDFIVENNNILKYTNASFGGGLTTVLTFLIQNNNHLKYMNNSIDSDLATILSFLVQNNNYLKYMNNSIDSDLSELLTFLIENSNHLKYMNASIQADLTELRDFIVENNNHLKYMNSSIDSDLADILDFLIENNNHLKYMNNSIDSDLTSLMNYLIALNNKLDSMNGTISSDLSGMLSFVIENNNFLKYMNSSIEGDLSALLSFVIENNNHLKFMNNSIDTDLNTLLFYATMINQKLTYLNMTVESELYELLQYAKDNKDGLGYLNTSLSTDLSELLNFVIENNNHLKYVNGSFNTELSLISNLLADIALDLDYLNLSLFSDLSDLFDLVERGSADIDFINNTFSTDLATIITLLGSTSGGVDSLNDTLDGIIYRITLLSKSLDGANASILAELQDLSSNLRSHRDEFLSFETNITLDIDTMKVILGYVNGTVGLLDTSETGWIKVMLEDIWDDINSTGADVDFFNGTITLSLASILNIVNVNSNDLAFLNGSISDVISGLTELRSELHGVNSSLKADLSALGLDIDEVLTDLDTIISELNAHRTEFGSFKGTYDLHTATMIALLRAVDVNVTNAASDLNILSGDMDMGFMEILVLLSAVDMNITTLTHGMTSLGNDITAILSTMVADLSGFNETIQNEIDMLRLRFESGLLSLALQLEAVNSSLHQELLGMDSDIRLFRSELFVGLSGLRDMMARSETNLSSSITEIEDLLNGIQDLSLAGISLRLEHLSDQIMTNDTLILETINELGSRISDFDIALKERLENISGLMSTRQDLFLLSSRLQNIEEDLTLLEDLEESLSNVEEEQSETKGSVSLSVIMAIIALIISLLILSVLVYLFFIKRKDDTESPSQITNHRR